MFGHNCAASLDDVWDQCIINYLFLIISYRLIWFVSDEKVDLTDGKWEDIHVTTGALKMFFRELPEPLFSYGSFSDFVNAISK